MPIQFIKPKIQNKLLLALSILSYSTFAYQLPEIGSSANTSLSYKTERLLGEYIYLDAQRDLPLVTNSLLEDYVQNLGTKLLNNSNKHYDNFQFFVVDSRDINAVSLPGGFIGINLGLINFADNESELAAVMAHEITHVNQRHIARSFEQNSQMQLPTMAGVIAGALLSAYSPEAGQSVMAGSMAASSQAMINYTRGYESEADRIGMTILTKSGYDPYSMGRFFNKLNRYSYSDSDNIPVYLRTHPVTTDRAHEANTRADEIAINKNTKKSLQVSTNPINNSDNFNFLLVKNLFNNSSINDLKSSLGELSNLNNTQIQQDVINFTIANKLIKNNDFTAANIILEKLHNKYNNNPIIASLYITSFNKQHDKALAILDQELKANPNNIPLSMQYAELALMNNKPQAALDVLKKMSKNNSFVPSRVTLLTAESYNKLNQKWQANLAFAEYSTLKGDYPAAIMQLKATAKFDKLTTYQSKILDYRIKELEAKYKERDEQVKSLI